MKGTFLYVVIILLMKLVIPGFNDSLTSNGFWITSVVCIGMIAFFFDGKIESGVKSSPDKNERKKRTEP